MKPIQYILILLLVASISSCNSQQKKMTDANAVVQVVGIEVFEKLEDSVQLIDIRTPKEYNGGYIKNAVNINFFDDDFMEQMSKLNKDEVLYIYCRSGGRSGSASEKLEEAGFTKVYDLGVGMKGWRKKDKPVTQNK